MRPIAAVLMLLGLTISAFGASPPAGDTALADALQVMVNNGVEAGVHAWYPDRADLATDMSAKVLGASRGLGDLIDTEVVARQQISKRVTRYYVALYFTRSPLWVRIDRYQNADKAFFLPLKCSVDPDDILPGYITEFLR